MLETLEEGGETEKDVFVKYPVMLERWLMEGSYDKVWEATRLNQVPSTEYGLFSTVSPPSSVMLCFGLLGERGERTVGKC